MKAIINEGHVIRDAPDLKETLAAIALHNYMQLLPGDNASDEAKELYDKKRLLRAAIAFAYVANDASKRASSLKRALQDLGAYKSPDYTEEEFPSDYDTLYKFFLSLRGAASTLLVPNDHTVHVDDKLKNPSTMFGNIPLRFSDSDKASVGEILARIEQEFFSIGVHETISRLMSPKYLPILRSVLGHSPESAQPLNEGAHPRDFGQKRFVSIYEQYLEEAILERRNAESSVTAFCKEDKVMFTEYEDYQRDINTRPLDIKQSVTTLTVRVSFFSFSPSLT